MRERPILFNGDMVRAILAGQKTQTRRVVKPQPPTPEDVRALAGIDYCWLPPSWPGAQHHRVGGPVWAVRKLMGQEPEIVCPFGQPGDRLWLRETWRPSVIHSCCEDACDCDSVGITYAADGQWVPFTSQAGPDDDWILPDAAARGYVPSIHMPRWACRLVLEITAVRVERLQAISEADALAEGIEEIGGRFTFNGGMHESLTPQISFQTLWDSTGGQWAANPWVWVIEFKAVKS
ncbi:hypothetical protein [Stenotrophomonas sp. GZD-301]|uniref:hypothetical protein n=1 Tax=Stenotrophomonas sp. GZD-301 TaxID=3404814 RepID=UPI003BB7112D